MTNKLRSSLSWCFSQGWKMSFGTSMDQNSKRITFLISEKVHILRCANQEWYVLQSSKFHVFLPVEFFGITPKDLWSPEPKNTKKAHQQCAHPKDWTKPLCHYIMKHNLLIGQNLSNNINPIGCVFFPFGSWSCVPWFSNDVELFSGHWLEITVDTN